MSGAKFFLAGDFMLASTLSHPSPDGLHAAIIPDGNGRWARLRGKPRSEGHRAGVEAVRRVVEAAPDFDIGTLTIFTFSSDNWQRPPEEVRGLFRLLQEYLANEVQRCVEHGVRVSVIGRRDRLPSGLRSLIGVTESATRDGDTLHLRLALDYSSRDAILRAATRMYSATEITRGAFARLLGGATHAGSPSPEVDLLIRTGGEQRLSDFLLWECAYAELYFTDKAWPEFDAEDLAAAVAEFHARERRFGRVPQAVAG
jgi:undecaprenyl diphosphate synthase